MKSLLHELQNNEAILLMYLANELPAPDREEVEHMLDRDDTLRLELAKIEEGYSSYHNTMRRMDAAMPPVSAFAAARAVGHAVRTRVLEPLSLDEHDGHRRRIHWALYPISAAAAVAIGMFLWWQVARDDMNKIVGPPIMVLNDSGKGLPREVPSDPDGGLAEADTQILRMFDPIEPDRGAEAERQLVALDYLNRSLQ